MANRVKEDEKNERIIRGLLKLPENRRCINCNSLCPQYVCTNFWTFVCTTCSGIHREFSHRVKSVSMAKFTSQEVTALQGGGNQRAKDIYLKDWDSQHNSLPDGSNVDKLRDFVKHVYVDGRFGGEKTSDRPPRGNMSDKEDLYRGSRSPPYEQNNERRYGDRSSSGGRSPGYDRECQQYGDYRKSPAHPEVVNDWRREDKFNNARKFDERRISDEESRAGGSPERPKDVDASSPPVIRPVRKILGENVVPLRVIEPPKPSGGTRGSNGLAQTQRTASSSSLGSSSGVEVKVENSPAILINFDADPEPPAAPAPPAPVPVQSPAVSQTMTSTHNNWASFDAAPSAVTSQPPPPIVNSLDSVLSQLTGPAGGNSVVAPTVGGSTIPHETNMLGFPPNTSFPAGLPTNGVTMLQPQQPSFFPAVTSGAQQTTLPFGRASANQSWNAPVVSNDPASQNSASTQVFILAPNPTVGINPSVPAQNPSTEVQSSARKELPADLFTASYKAYPGPTMGWQAGLPYGMGYMQYHPVMPVPSLLQQSSSVNPFDVNDPSPVQAPTFPSMESLQGALPHMQPGSVAPRPSTVGIPPSWGSPLPPAYMSAVPPNAPAFASALPPGPYVGQQVMGSYPPSRYPEARAFGNEGTTFGHPSVNPSPNVSFPAPYTQSSSAPVGGNPFG
ncbi:hypothetical protein MLD38_005729 [Melastoma candidum]|uniref:Uncharacterized protein n=1 Tax=Melastoma candidum TaxID=119954 RepID=A0ACB9RLU7_9MYRT|nr:hypothetical protein MLD38_005729 [Melastoma candidum]